MKNGSVPDSAARSRRILRTSVVGIAANVLLAAFKAMVGFAANSVAVILDAVNNLADLEGRFPNRAIALNFDTDYSD